MMKIAICDDEPRAAEEIRILLQALQKKYDLVLSVEVFHRAATVLKERNSKTEYDLYYLDIEMRYMDGIELARNIRKHHKFAKIIYVTSYENYAVQTFEVQPFQFMIKPINESLFEQYFLQVYKEYQSKDTFYHYSFNKVHYRKLVKDIAYFYSNRRIITMVDYESHTHKFTGKLNEVEKDIAAKNRFLRIHQSYLVNYDHIQQISADKIQLVDGTILTISSERSEEVSKKYAQFVRREKCY
ncbi:MAG: LytTR family DNA-binding domain-containing protein [Eubacteriales bacterium]